MFVQPEDPAKRHDQTISPLLDGTHGPKRRVHAQHTPLLYDERLELLNRFGDGDCFAGL